MNWRFLFNLKGLNFWLLASGIGLNLIWTFLILMFTVGALDNDQNARPGGQVWMMIGIFIGAFLIGWLISKMAADNRGPTYGLIGSLGSVLLLIFVLLPAGELGLLAAGAALAGGLNGGLFSQR